MRRGCAGQWCDGNCFILACVLRHYCVRRTLTRLQCISSPPFSPLFISPMVPSPSLSGPFTCLASALVIGDFPCLGPSLGGAIRSSQRFCPIIPASSTLSPISVPAVLQHWRLPQTAISEHWISCLCSSLSKTCFQYRAYRTAHSHESKRLIYLLPQFSACMADSKVDQPEKCRICEARFAPTGDDGCRVLLDESFVATRGRYRGLPRGSHSTPVFVTCRRLPTFNEKAGCPKMALK